MVEFCRKGLTGGRIDQIAGRAGCNIRMIYHYFGSKEKLYLAVLERVYQHIREREQALNLRSHEPVEGMVALVDFTFTYLLDHPEFITLIGNENMLRGRYLRKSEMVPQSTLPLVEAIEDLLRRGTARGQFRADVDPVQLYVTIVALCYFHIGNRYTLSIMFRDDFGRGEWLQARQQHAREVVLGYLRP